MHSLMMCFWCFLLLSPLPEYAEFTRTATWVRGWSEEPTEKLSYSLRGGQRDPELHQELWTLRSGVTHGSLTVRRLTLLVQNTTTRNLYYLETLLRIRLLSLSVQLRFYMTNMSACNWESVFRIDWFFSSGDEENLLQLSAATINAEWLLGSTLGQSCQGQCASGSCSVCRAAATDCSDHKPTAEGTNVQKPKVDFSVVPHLWRNEWHLMDMF